VSLAPRVLVHSSNFDLERELLTEELKAEREPPVPIEVTEIKQWYAWETEAPLMVLVAQLGVLLAEIAPPVVLAPLVTQLGVLLAEITFPVALTLWT